MAEGKLEIRLKQDVLKLISDVAADIANSGVATPLEVLGSLIAVFYLMAPAHSGQALLEELAPSVWEAIKSEVTKNEVTQ